MKKIFVIIGLFCGFVGNSWAVCELTKSTDRTQSDEDIYLSKEAHDTTRMALICQKGKCEDGEIIYVWGSHYKKNRRIEDGAYYKCKLGGNDRWLKASRGDIPVSDEREDLIMFFDSEQVFIYGKAASDGNYYTNVHYVKPDERCGVKCTPENEDKNFYCDNAVIDCFEGTFGEYASFFGACEYSDPQTRIDNYIIENEWFDKMSFWGAYVLHDGEVVNSDMNVCQGCKSGLVYGGDGYCYSNLDQAWCNWRKNKDGKNVEWVDDNHCECKDSGMEWNTEQHDCVKSGNGGNKPSGKTNTSTGGGKTGNKTGVNTGNVNKTCAEMYPGNAEAIACCEFGKNGGAEWKDNKCICAGENKKWEYSDNIKAGHCVDDKKPEKKPEVKNNNIDCVVELGASVKCKNGTRFDKTASVSVSSEKCNLYKSNVAKYLNEIAGLLCADAGGVGNVMTDAELQSAIEDLNRFFEYAKSNASVWKNAEGNFNTARLASDATAGVILGTVGGIVSAKIIKKKQVEKGFDVLNCTVGGQKVADWGDEFTVGFGK